MKVAFFQFKVLKTAQSSTKVIFIIISVAHPKLCAKYLAEITKMSKKGETVKFEVCIQAISFLSPSIATRACSQASVKLYQG